MKITPPRTTAWLSQILLASLLLAASPLSVPVWAAGTPLSIGSASQRLPAGTLMRIALQNTLDSRLSQPGEPFNATLVEDLVAPGGRLVLPKGTLLRGRLSTVEPSRFFSKGGLLGLGFDHVVLPNGQQQTVSLKLSGLNALSSSSLHPGQLYADPGIGPKIAQSLDDGATFIGKSVQVGMDWGKDIGNGAGRILTVPVAALGGVLGGGGLIVGKSVYSAVAKGNVVSLKPGDVLLVELAQPTTFPAAD